MIADGKRTRLQIRLVNVIMYYMYILLIMFMMYTNVFFDSFV